MVRKLAGLAMLCVASASSFGQIDHSQLINRVAGGTGAIAGADLSQLEAAETTFGYGAQWVSPGTTTNNVMADDFTVGAGGFLMTSIRLFTYQTGATAPSITGANWAVGSAATRTLNTGSAITNGWWNPNGVGVYRVTSTSTTDSTRRIQFVDIDVPDTFLAAGTHFLSFQFIGSLASGPWAPPLPTSLGTHGFNALQSTLAAPTFTPVANGTGGADLAFVINGQAVPEPGTMIALGLGAAALIRRRRKG
jgi:hypothetical protein